MIESRVKGAGGFNRDFAKVKIKGWENAPVCRRRISPLVNIPALALRKRAFYGFAWYVHPYPRVRQSVNIAELEALAMIESRVQSAGGFDFAAHQKRKITGHSFECPVIFLVEPTGIEPVSKGPLIQPSP